VEYRGRITCAYRGLGDVEIGGICDSDPARLEQAGREFEVENRYSDYRQMLESNHFDLVAFAQCR
jgi:predicted dehydrogenase